MGAAGATDPGSLLQPPSLESHSTSPSPTGTLITSLRDLPPSPLNVPFLLRMLSIAPNSIADLQDQDLDLKYLLSLDSYHTPLSTPSPQPYAPDTVIDGWCPVFALLFPLPGPRLIPKPHTHYFSFLLLLKPIATNPVPSNKISLNFETPGSQTSEIS